uniref:Uncharacterized protein n=1 Tax=Glossina pallidipes TaxID=7398 RepID=A0A1B0ADC4_GLOPL
MSIQLDQLTTIGRYNHKDMHFHLTLFHDASIYLWRLDCVAVRLQYPSPVQRFTRPASKNDLLPPTPRYNYIKFVAVLHSASLNCLIKLYEEVNGILNLDPQLIHQSNKHATVASNFDNSLLKRELSTWTEDVKFFENYITLIDLQIE